jgi:hypothetical protein
MSDHGLRIAFKLSHHCAGGSPPPVRPWSNSPLAIHGIVDAAHKTDATCSSVKPDFAISAALKRVKEGCQASLREIGRLKEVGDEWEVMFGVLSARWFDRPASTGEGYLLPAKA